MQSLEVENLLQSLESEGELDSSGSFTLDISQAAPKLAKFQLSDPFQYVLKLVQAAVSGQAERFELRSGSTEVQCTMHGVAFEPHQLANLLYYLIQDDQTRVDPALKHLAMGVNAAVGTRAWEIVLRSFNGERGCEVRWTRECNRLSEWKPKDRLRQTHFSMQRVSGDVLSELYQKVASRDFMGMFTGDRQSMDREQALTYDACAFSPIPVVLNGQSIPGYDLGAPAYAPGIRAWLRRLWTGRSEPDPKHHLLECYQSSAPGHVGLGPPNRSHAPVRLGWEGDVSYDRILALPYGFAALKHTRVIPVQDGVMLPQLRFSWQGPSGIYYLSAAEFPKDLTSLQLICNERLEQQLDVLAQEFLLGCEQLLSGSGARLPSVKRQTLQKALEQARARPVSLVR